MVTFLVTGGIGSGKSAVSEILRSEGIPVYDSDSAARRLYGESEALRRALASAYGPGILTPHGADIAALARRAFSSPREISDLNALVHPAVMDDFKSWRDSLGDVPFCAMESAVALSSPVFKDFFDFTIIVQAPEEERIRRVCARTPGMTPEKVVERMALQDHGPVPEPYAVIENDSDFDSLRQRTQSALNLLYLHFEQKQY